jgi:hypothetical protein
MKPLIAVAAGLLAGVALLLCADAAVTALVMGPAEEVVPVPAEDRPYQRFDRGWYSLKRSFRGRDYWGADVYDVATDQYGFRIDDRAPIKPGPARTIFLGDSFTYGVNGPWDQTFVGLYDLKSRGRILNAAVPSYSPTAYRYTYQAAIREAAVSGPHDVVLMLDIGDVQDEAAVWRDGPEHPYDLRVENGEAAAVVRQRDQNARSWRERLRLTRSAYETVRYSILKIPNAAVFDQFRSAFTWADWAMLDRIPASMSGFAPDGVDRALERVRNQVAGIAALASQSGGRLFVGVYPWPAQLAHPSHFDWPGFVREACRGTCAGVIDTFPAFRQRVEADKDWYHSLYVFGDVHFNRAGNQLVFEEIARVIPPGR